MNEKTDSKFMEDIRTVLSVPEMQPEFDAQLAEKLKMKMRANNRSNVSLTQQKSHRWAYSIPALFILLVLMVVIVIGPQRVLAAIRSLGFLQGFGYVQGDTRVLAEPVLQERAGITLEVYEGVSDTQHTWLSIALKNADAEYFATGPVTDECQLKPYLILDSGEVFFHEWTSLHSMENEAIMETSFSAIPVDIEKTTLVIPCIPNLPEALNAEDWIFKLSFIPFVDDAGPLPAEPIYIPTEDPTTSVIENTGDTDLPSENDNDNGPDVQIVVDNFVELADGYQFQGYIMVPDNADFQFNMDDLFLSDMNGTLIETYPEDVPFGSNAPAGSVPWILRTSSKDLPPELVFNLEALSLPRSDEAVSSETIQLDLGPAPQVGQEWTLVETINVAGFDVIFRKATLEQLTPDIYLLVLKVEYSEDNIQSLDLADTDTQMNANTAGGGGGGGSGNLHLETIDYNSIPKGVRNIYVTKANIVNHTGWSTVISMP